MATSIVSYNVNGIRAAIRKGLVEWIDQSKPDIICIQETKARPGQVNVAAFEALGYHHYWHSAQKKGYSGVLTLSRKEPDQVVSGTGITRYDEEGRVLRTDFDDWTLLNCYFPSGTSGDERQAFKMAFLDDFYRWVADLKKERPRLVVVGDYNIAHSEIDIHDPVRNKKSSGFLPEERAWMSRWFESGFTDTFRILNPEKVEYSWWSYRARSRERNKGWRIDYQSVTDNLADQLVEARQLTEVVHSDHCPVLLKLDVPY
ncbi:MAG: exodeoxyribonuclease III [Saprospiraceae bacterium]|nr:exodeoxyribonuclease III [Saprospiraceae bacterium]